MDGHASHSGYQSVFQTRTSGTLATSRSLRSACTKCVNYGCRNPFRNCRCSYKSSDRADCYENILTSVVLLELRKGSECLACKAFVGGCKSCVIKCKRSKGTRSQRGYTHTFLSTNQRLYAFYTTPGNAEVTGTGQPRFSSANVYNIYEIVIRDNITPRPTVVEERPPTTRCRNSCI